MKNFYLSFVFLILLTGVLRGQMHSFKSDYVVTRSMDTIYGNVKFNNGLRLLLGDIRIKEKKGKSDIFNWSDFHSFSVRGVPYMVIYDDRFYKRPDRFFASVSYPGKTMLLGVENPKYIDFEKEYLKKNRNKSRFAYYPVIDYFLMWDKDEGAFKLNHRRYKARLISKLHDNKDLVKWIRQRKFDFTQIPKLMFLYNGGDFLTHGKWSKDYVVTRNGDSIFGQLNLSRRVKIYPSRNKKKYYRYSYNQLQSFRWFSVSYECLKLDSHREKKPYWVASQGEVNLYVQGVNQAFSFDENGNVIGCYHDSGVYYMEKNGKFCGPLSRLNVNRYIRQFMADCPEILLFAGAKYDRIMELKSIVDYYNRWILMKKK
ncbi:MAG: hypothetical protein ACEPOW_12950 [Bacteroidales bacterium]